MKFRFSLVFTYFVKSKDILNVYKFKYAHQTAFAFFFLRYFIDRKFTKTIKSFHKIMLSLDLIFFLY